MLQSDNYATSDMTVLEVSRKLTRMLLDTANMSSMYTYMLVYTQIMCSKKCVPSFRYSRGKCTWNAFHKKTNVIIITRPGEIRYPVGSPSNRTNCFEAALKKLSKDQGE